MGSPFSAAGLGAWIKALRGKPSIPTVDAKKMGSPVDLNAMADDPQAQYRAFQESQAAGTPYIDSMGAHAASGETLGEPEAAPAPTPRGHRPPPRR